MTTVANGLSLALQLGPALPVVPQLDDRKLDPDATAPQAVLIARGAPPRTGVAQHGQADHRAVVTVKQAVALYTYMRLGKPVSRSP